MGALSSQVPPFCFGYRDERVFCLEEVRMKAIMKKWQCAVMLFVMGVVLLPYTVLAASGTVVGPVVGATTYRFDVTGDLICNPNDDWAPPNSAPTTAGPATPTACTAGGAIFSIPPISPVPSSTYIAAERRQDAVSSSTDDIYSTGSKQNDTSTWAEAMGSAPAKSDIGNIYTVARLGGIDPDPPGPPGSFPTNNLIAMLAFERNASNGSAHLDYELNQVPFVLNPSGLAMVPQRCSFDGQVIGSVTCKSYDIILAIDDGTTIAPDLNMYKWVGDTCTTPSSTCAGGYRTDVGNFVLIPNGTVPLSVTNTTPIPAGPWGTFVKGKKTFNTTTAPNPIPVDAFSEVALDLTAALGLQASCPGVFKTIFVKSRASAEVNSALKDMVTPPIPFGLDTCSTMIVNKVDASDPNNVVPLAGAVFTITPDPATGTGSITVTSNALGVVFSSTQALPGIYTVHEVSSPLGNVPPPDQTCDLSMVHSTCTLTFVNIGNENLTATKSASPASGSSVVSGQLITFTINYSNTGATAPAFGVVITDTVDPLLTNIVPLNGGTLSGNVITWNVGTVPINGSGSVQFTANVVSPLANAIILNKAHPKTNKFPAGFDTNVTQHNVGAPNLSASKAVDKATAIPGEMLTYTVDYANAGPGDATGVVLTDTIPARTTLVAGSVTGGGSCTGTVPGSVCTWAIGTLLHGVGGSVSFKVTLDSVFPNGTTTVTNTATLSSNELPPVVTQISTGVNAAPILTLSKTLTSSVNRTISNFTNTSSATSAEVVTPVTSTHVVASQLTGVDITYTLSYSNIGDADASNFVIVDTLPAGACFIAASSGGVHSGGTVTTDCPDGMGGTVTWTIPSLPASGSGSVTLQVRTGL